MKVEKHDYGHAIYSGGNLLALATEGIAACGKIPTAEIIKDLYGYIRTGKATEKLEKIMRVKPGVFIMYSTYSSAELMRMRIQPKTTVMGKTFYLVNPQTGWYVFDGAGNVYYLKNDNIIKVSEPHYTVLIKPDIKPVNRYSKKIVENLWDREKFDKIIRKMFPIRNGHLTIRVKPDTVTAKSPHDEIKITVEGNKFIVYAGKHRVYEYAYGCGTRISRAGYDPGAAPCLKKL